jgi:hypothetical protein
MLILNTSNSFDEEGLVCFQDSVSMPLYFPLSQDWVGTELTPATSSLHNASDIGARLAGFWE